MNRKLASFSRFALLALSLVVVSCGPVYNNSSLDQIKYGSPVSGSANFQEARLVLLNRCTSCHGAWASWNEADFVSQGKIEARSPNTSILYTRTRGNDSGVAGDMPLSGSNPTTQEVATIKNWIQNY